MDLSHVEFKGWLSKSLHSQTFGVEHGIASFSAIYHQAMCTRDIKEALVVFTRAMRTVASNLLKLSVSLVLIFPALLFAIQRLFYPTLDS
jgi:hypothetical protein